MKVSCPERKLAQYFPKPKMISINVEIIFLITKSPNFIIKYLKISKF